MNQLLEVAPYIHTVGDERVKNELYLSYFDVKQVGNVKGAMPIIGIDFNETEASYAKRLRNWRFADREVLFDGWIVKDMKHWHVMQREDVIIIFEFTTYTVTIGAKEYKFNVLPETVDDFINDFKRIGVKLFWKQEIIDKFGKDKLSSSKKVIEYHKILKQSLE